MALSWTLSLKDAMSGAAGKAAASIGRVYAGMKALGQTKGGDQAAKQLDTLAASANRAAKAMAKVRGGSGAGGGKVIDTKAMKADFADMLPSSAGGAAALGTGIGMTIAGAAAAATATMWKGIWDVGAMIQDAGAFKQSTMFAFEQITKTKEAAAAAYALASKTAIDVGGDLRTNMSAMNSLMAQGFDTRFADQLIRAMADLKTINPSANMEGITRAISQIKTTGRLQGDEMMQLAEAGLNVQAVYEQIGKQMGLVAKGGKSAAAQVQDLQAKGKVSSDQAIAAIMATIKNQVGGREFGAVATEKADKSLAGMAMRAMSLKEQFLASINIDWSPLSNALGRLMAAFQGPAGERFAKKLEAGFNRLVGLFDRISQGDMEGMLDTAGDMFERLTTQADKFVTRIEKISKLMDRFTGDSGNKGGGIGSVFDSLSAGGDWLTNLPETLDGWIGTIPGKFGKMADSAGNAFRNLPERAGAYLVQLPTKIYATVDAVSAYLSALPGRIYESIASAAVTVGAFFESLPGTVIATLSALPGQLYEAASGLGTAISDGIASGIAAGLQSITDAAVGVAKGALDSASSFLKVGSPSKLFHDKVGAPVGQGMAAGIKQETPAVGQAANRMGAAAFTAGQRISGAITNNASTRNMSATLVQNGGDETDARASLRQLADELRSMNAAAA